MSMDGEKAMREDARQGRASETGKTRGDGAERTKKEGVEGGSKAGRKK